MHLKFHWIIINIDQQQHWRNENVRGKSDSGCDERFFPVKTSIVLIHNALTSDTSVAWRIAQFMTLECKRKRENYDATNEFVFAFSILIRLSTFKRQFELNFVLYFSFFWQKTNYRFLLEKKVFLSDTFCVESEPLNLWMNDEEFCRHSTTSWAHWKLYNFFLLSF